MPREVIILYSTTKHCPVWYPKSLWFSSLRCCIVIFSVLLPGEVVQEMCLDRFVDGSHFSVIVPSEWYLDALSDVNVCWPDESVVFVTTLGLIAVD